MSLIDLLPRAFLKAMLTQFASGLDSAAKATETKLDDEAVDVLQAAIEEEVLFDWFYGKVTADPGTLSFEAPTPEVLSVLAARGISFERFRELIGPFIPGFRDALIALLLKKFIGG